MAGAKRRKVAVGEDIIDDSRRSRLFSFGDIPGGGGIAGDVSFGMNEISFRIAPLFKNGRQMYKWSVFNGQLLGYPGSPMKTGVSPSIKEGKSAVKAFIAGYLRKLADRLG